MSVFSGASFRDHEILAVILGAVAIFLLSSGSDVSYTTSDSLGTLLTAQSIIEHGTIRLDPYAGNVTKSYVSNKERLSLSTGQFRLVNNHIYHYYPLGSALIAIPPVFFAWMSGHDMKHQADDETMQSFLSTLTCSLVFIVSFFAARCVLGFGWSIGIALLFSLGTSYISTMGTALWSANFATLFLLCAVVFLFRYHYRGIHPPPILLGLLLFCAYICRPTAIIAFVCLSVYIYAHLKRSIIPLVGTFTICFIGLILFSQREFGELLPPYYTTFRMFECGSLFFIISGSILSLWIIRRYIAVRCSHNAIRIVLICSAFILVIVAFDLVVRFSGLPLYVNVKLIKNTAQAFYGNLFSPSRGIFIFSPFLLLPIIVTVFSFIRLKRDDVFVVGIVWFLLHLSIVSRPTRWHGGHCFGNRLSTEAIPSLFLLTVCVIKHYPVSRWKFPRITWLIIIVTGVMSIFIHTYQGLYNPYSAQWNVDPNIDEYSQYLFNWRYPQFLANPRMLEAKRAYHAQIMEESQRHAELSRREKWLKKHPFAAFNGPITPQRNDMIYSNWLKIHPGKQDNLYQTGQNGSTVWFFVPRNAVVSDTLKLHFTLAGNENLILGIRINEFKTSPFRLHGLEQDTYSIKIPRSAIVPGHANGLHFSLQEISMTGDGHHDSITRDMIFLFWSCTITGLTPGVSGHETREPYSIHRPSRQSRPKEQ